MLTLAKQNDNGLSLKNTDAIEYLRWMQQEAAKYDMSIGVKNSLDILNDVSSFVDFAVKDPTVPSSKAVLYSVRSVPNAWNFRAKQSTTSRISSSARAPEKRPSAYHLPEVCRQVYSETATLAYKLNMFILGASQVLSPNWATMLLPAQREAITRIKPEPRYLMLLVDMYATRTHLRGQTQPSLRTIIVSDWLID